MMAGVASGVASWSQQDLPGSRWARQARPYYARLRHLVVKAAAIPADLSDPKWAEVASVHDSRCRAYQSLLPAMAAHGCRVGELEPAGLIFLPEPTREACLRRMVEWFTLGDTNEAMVDRLKDYGWVQSEAVEQAMKAVDRRLFTLDPERAYLDFSIPGLSWDTVLTAPYMQAFGFWLLRDGLVPGAKVLDIGSGSGYATAVMAHMVTCGGADGKAIGIELFDELTQQAKERAASIPALADLLDNGSLQYVTGDGREGMLSEAPFDVIYCGAAAEDIPGDILVQLKEGGYMVVPLGHTNPSVGFLGALGGAQVLAVFEHTPEGFGYERVCPSTFQPLTGPQELRNYMQHHSFVGAPKGKHILTD